MRAIPAANFESEEKQMTTSKNSNRQNNWEHHIRGGVSALEGFREAQSIDYSTMEESYELLPSGD